MNNLCSRNHTSFHFAIRIKITDVCLWIFVVFINTYIWRSMVAFIASLFAHSACIFFSRSVRIDGFSFYVITVANLSCTPHIAGWQSLIHKSLNLRRCHRARIIENTVIYNSSRLKIGRFYSNRTRSVFDC